MWGGTGGTVLVPPRKGHAANLPFPCMATGARHSVNVPCTGSKPHRGFARSALGRINYFTQGKSRKDTRESNSLYPNHHHVFRGQKTPQSASQVQQKWLFLQLQNTWVT